MEDTNNTRMLSLETRRYRYRKKEDVHVENRRM